MFRFPNWLGNVEWKVEGKRDILDMQWSELESRADFVKNRFSDIFKPDMLWKNLRLEKDDREGGEV